MQSKMRTVARKLDYPFLQRQRGAVLTLSFLCSCGCAKGLEARGSMQFTRPRVSPTCSRGSAGS